MLVDLLPYVQVDHIEPSKWTLTAPQLGTALTAGSDEEVLAIMKQYYDFTAKVDELGLGSAIEEKPRIDVSIIDIFIRHNFRLICLTSRLIGQRIECHVTDETLATHKIPHA